MVNWLTDWGHRKSHTITEAVTVVGTINVTNASTTVTGTSTGFLNWSVGNKILLPDSNWYTIATIGNETSLTLTAAYGAASSYNQTYKMQRINYQVAIKVYKTTGTDGTESIYGLTAGKVYVGSDVLDSFADVRFCDSTGNAALDYWLMESTSGTSAFFWVEIPSIISDVATTIYVYYKKDDATTISNGSTTFAVFDDFNGSSLNTADWNSGNATNGAPANTSVSSSICTLNGTSHHIDHKTKIAYPARFWGKYKIQNDAGGDCMVGIGDLGVNYLYNAKNAAEWYSISTDTHRTYLRINDTFIGPLFSTDSELGTYHNRQIKGTRGRIDFFNESTGVGNCTNATQITSAAMSHWFESRSANNVLIDWVFTAKFTTTEPSHAGVGSWGDEESSGPTAYNKTVVDLVGAVSTFVKHRGVYKTLADIVSGVGTFVKHCGRLRIFTDKLGAIDSKLRHIFRLKTLTDKLGTVGSKIRITTLFRTFVSLLGLKDTKTKSIARLKTFIQLIGLKDSISSITKTLHRIFTNVLGAKHTFWKQKFTGGAQDIVKELSDILGVIDSKTNIISRIRLFLDKIGAKDSKTNSHIYIKILLDKLGLKDSKFVSYVSGTFRWIWKEHPKVKVEKQ